MIKIKAIDLEILYNFVVDNIFYLSLFRIPILISKLDKHNTRRNNISYRHKFE